MKNLVIVESPAKAKTIKKFLGEDYEVIASKGHIRDLPQKKFGIKIDGNKFSPEYEISTDHEAIVSQIKNLAKKAGQIYLATDEDREGEAIAYHIAESIGKAPTSLPRIVFHEITKSAIDNAINSPRTLDMNSVNAQQARRLLDRIVGYKLSPLLNTKIQRGLSAGRVQSAALKIIVDKEREIRAFVPVEYHSIDAVFKKKLEAEFVKFNGEKMEKLSIKTKAQADKILKILKSEEFSVSAIESKSRKTAPSAPFMTSTLQQAASTSLGFNPRKTMSLAQSLYEGVNTNFGGAITYMRTDSLNLAKEAVAAARDMIEKTYGAQYLPKSPNIYTTKSKGAQEAHEAIRPTNIAFTPQMAKATLPRDEARLYTLIYNRFIACQMSASTSDIQTITICGESAEFRISGRKVTFDGFYKVYGDLDKDKILPELKKGDKMELESLGSEQHFTEAPARYSEASLIKKLESLGIGRPSTYAPTITLLTSKKYVEIDKKQLIPAEVAFKITEVLEGHFKNIVDSNFTAKMEEKLDEIAENKADWQEILANFYYPFMDEIAKGKSEIASQKISEPIGEKCPQCGKELVRRAGRFGEFIACEGYPKCKYSRNLGESADEASKSEPEKIGEKCPQCGKELVRRAGRFGEFIACEGYPKCKYSRQIEGAAKAPAKKATSTGVICPKCAKGDVVERFSRRGKFYGCSNYPKCDFVSNYAVLSRKCPECKNTYMVRKELKKGNFAECPKCKFKEEIE
ncbi:MULTISPECIES: type I DNA topoisomerase [unclassified Campylobacter]|uniref:type I DNA topoisomerase n=1 Tax=unclassified Campylobacter TaxID=2593542 RepID=UPI0022E9E310|nr:MULTISPECIES: type I DNA topoisomerase [unclassified Campylobacter]MDA3043964.1 type I DNA topoisomerase [Campylobacter sp. JMF_09 ED2]MDA3045527.1 type I DNA topoisomerase [Campylobacter sp. JMF_07 ED4]MDA3064628.1 type I DNA topoisomerase [Campylobacter sp. JMF_11 EL3]MDA3075686.1 type I DNA topoisomerase [Campylobacter sp. JMF_05 ED3]